MAATPFPAGPCCCLCFRLVILLTLFFRYLLPTGVFYQPLHRPNGPSILIRHQFREYTLHVTAAAAAAAERQAGVASQRDLRALAMSHGADSMLIEARHGLIAAAGSDIFGAAGCG